MPIKIQMRHDTAANWVSANPILMAGEVGVNMDTGQVKVGNGSNTWNTLAYSLTGPQGIQGDMGSPFLALSGPNLIVTSGASINLTMSVIDTYTSYSVSAANGIVSLNGSVITYTGQAIGDDIITIHAGDSTRNVTVQVVEASLGTQPAAPPNIGDAHLGGYYTGNIWDTATTSNTTTTVSTGAKTMTIQAADLTKFYVGQNIRLGVGNNSANGIMQGTVVGGASDKINLNITSIIGGNIGSSYSSWVIAVPWKIIVSPKSSGEIGSVQYKTTNTADPTQCTTLTNGVASTAAMQALNNPLSPIYPMAQWVTNINLSGGIGGFTDWYIPARDELELIWRNLKPTTNNNYSIVARQYSTSNIYKYDSNVPDSSDYSGLNRNSYPPGAAYTAAKPAQTSVVAFKTGGVEAMGLGLFWSCSEFSSIYGWYHSYNSPSPGYQGNSYRTKDYSTFSRCIRRSIL
jgi:hypothetical protein